MVICVMLQLLLVFSLLIGCKKLSDNSKFMDRDYTATIKYGCSIIVMLSHIDVPENCYFLGNLHFVCVTLFFLFSGYGLTYQYKIFGGKATKIQAVLKLVIPYIIVIMIKSILSIPIEGGGMYYMNVIIMFYIVFFFILTIAKNTMQFLILIAISNIMYALGAQLYIQQMTDLFGWGSQSLGFLFGVLLCVFQEQIYLFFRKWALVLILISSLILLMAGKSYIKIRDISCVSNEAFLLRIILSFCVICVLFSISTHCVIGNRFSIYMGNKCMYIFLLHGVVIGILDIVYDIKNPGIYMMSIVIATLVMSIIFECIAKNIQGLCKKLSRFLKTV